MPVRAIKIVLIEDSATTRAIYKALFQRLGFEVHEAEDAKKGWQIICDQKPDIIVLDMIMPEISGLELLKRIRSYPFSKDIPVLVLTSVDDPEQIKDIYRQGADHYCLKSMVSTDVMKETIYSLMKSVQEKKKVLQLHGESNESEKSDISDLDRSIFWI